MSGSNQERNFAVHGAVIGFDLQALASTAVCIALGRVKAVAVQVLFAKVERLKREILFSDHVVSVDQFLKLPPSYQPLDQLVVRTLGGRTPAASMDAPDEAKFAPQERVLLFLSKDTGGLFDLKPNEFTVLGAFQGKYSVFEIEGKDMAARIDEREPRPLEALTSEIKRQVS